jgi:hypothetical protein
LEGKHMTVAGARERGQRHTERARQAARHYCKIRVYGREIRRSDKNLPEWIVQLGFLKQAF